MTAVYERGLVKQVIVLNKQTQSLQGSITLADNKSFMCNKRVLNLEGRQTTQN
ncbi:hypothetical protein GJ744_002648 [Endocarpon pusillum]|uniref:Uncharacterized protein n=1 Tax=Endocarpon pusillum TaxID=364733 RepID=A0A8H7E099_9EURO|nr:hypothetical protein GJ744_002648 [Endocarpon pusillum]